MDIIKNQALDALAQKRLFVFPEIKATLHTKDGDFDLTHVTNFRISRHFTTNITDVFYIEFMSTLGFIADVLFKYKDDLEISITLNYLNKSIKEYLFKLIIVSEFPQNKLTSDSAKLDTQSLQTVKGQCIDPLMLKLKNVYISGIYHNYQLGYFLRSLLNYEFNKITVAGNKIKYRLNVYEPDNQREYRNIVLKPFTKVINIPYILHHEKFGLYLYGFNTYFSLVNYGCECLTYTGKGTQDPEHLYGNSFDYSIDIFPTHDYTRYEKEVDRTKLNIIIDSDMGKNENDFSYENGIFTLVVEKIEYKDVSDKVLYNIGNTLANTYPEEMIKYESYDIYDDDITTDVTQFGDLVTTDKDPDAFQAILVNDRLTNRFKLLSELNKNNIVMATIKLGKINPDFIYPGMPVRKITKKGNKLLTTDGTVSAVDWYYDVPNKTIVTVLILALKKEDKEV